VCGSKETLLAEQYRPHSPSRSRNRCRASCDRAMKAADADNMFVPASQLVKDAFLKENVDATRKPLDAVPRPQHLEQYANNHRRRNRPADPDPSNLHFELDMNHIPDDFM